MVQMALPRVWLFCTLSSNAASFILHSVFSLLPYSFRTLCVFETLARNSHLTPWSCNELLPKPSILSWVNLSSSLQRKSARSSQSGERGAFPCTPCPATMKVRKYRRSLRRCNYCCISHGCSDLRHTGSPTRA